MKELLEKAEAVKEERRKQDVEALKEEAEKMKVKSGVLGELEKQGTGSSAKKGNNSLSAAKRKDAPPYKVRFLL